MQKYLVEFIVAGILFCTVEGSGIMGSNLSPDNDGVILLANTLATFFALYFLITTFQNYGNAHFNPSVSMVAYLRKEITISEFLIILIDVTDKWTRKAISLVDVADKWSRNVIEKLFEWIQKKNLNILFALLFMLLLGILAQLEIIPKIIT